MPTTDFTFTEGYDKKTRWLPDSERKKLYYEIVNFSKEAKITDVKFKKREWFEKWNQGLQIPGFYFKAIFSLPGRDKDAMYQLSKKVKTLTGWSMYDTKKRIDYFQGRNTNDNYRGSKTRNPTWSSKQQQQKPPTEGSQRT